MSAAPQTGSCFRLRMNFSIGSISQKAAILLAASFAAIVPASTAFAAPSLAAANADLQAGKADEAISLLNETLRADATNAEAENLLCRVQYTLQQFDLAAGNCEKAVSLNGQNARYHLWLGRATGERASRASFLSAFSLAKKTRQELETAVKLDPRDVEALSDLGEFYVEAPGAVGGGVDKASGIAAQLDSIESARAHQLRAAIAEKNKDLATAEQEFKTALSVATHPAYQWISLASFYRRQQRWADMEAAVKSGEEAASRDKHAAVALYNGASVLTRANRQLDQAIRLYQSYLASPDKTEEAPAFAVHARLARLLAQTGDQASAQRERDAALALAHDFKPAQDIKTQGTRN